MYVLDIILWPYTYDQSGIINSTSHGNSFKRYSCVYLQKPCLRELVTSNSMRKPNLSKTISYVLKEEKEVGLYLAVTEVFFTFCIETLLENWVFETSLSWKFRTACYIWWNTLYSVGVVWALRTTQCRHLPLTILHTHFWRWHVLWTYLVQPIYALELSQHFEKNQTLLKCFKSSSSER